MTHDYDPILEAIPIDSIGDLTHAQMEYVAAKLVELSEAQKPDSARTWKFDAVLNEASLSRLADEMEEALQKSGHASDRFARQADLLDAVFTRMTLLGMQNYAGERSNCEKLRAAMLAQRLCTTTVDNLHKYDPNHAMVRKIPERTE